MGGRVTAVFLCFVGGLVIGMWSAGAYLQSIEDSKPEPLLGVEVLQCSVTHYDDEAGGWLVHDLLPDSP